MPFITTKLRETVLPLRHSSMYRTQKRTLMRTPISAGKTLSHFVSVSVLNL